MDATAAARLVRHGGGVLGIIGAGLLLLRGRIGIASALAGMAATFAGWRPKTAGWTTSRGPGAGARAGQTSTARSAMIEMRLDHRSGIMTGAVLAGAFSGRALGSLSRPDLLVLRAELARDDPDGVSLLETYLDRRFAGWRDADQGQRERRRSGGASGVMTRGEAYEILGLPEGAGANGNHSRSPGADEEVSSRSWRFDRSCREGQSGQGCSDATTRLRRSAKIRGPGSGRAAPSVSRRGRRNRKTRCASGIGRQTRRRSNRDRRSERGRTCPRPCGPSRCRAWPSRAWRGCARGPGSEGRWPWRGRRWRRSGSTSLRPRSPRARRLRRSARGHGGLGRWLGVRSGLPFGLAPASETEGLAGGNAAVLASALGSGDFAPVWRGAVGPFTQPSSAGVRASRGEADARTVCLAGRRGSTGRRATTGATAATLSVGAVVGRVVALGELGLRGAAGRHMHRNIGRHQDGTWTRRAALHGPRRADRLRSATRRRPSWPCGRWTRRRYDPR